MESCWVNDATFEIKVKIKNKKIEKDVPRRNYIVRTINWKKKTYKNTVALKYIVKINVNKLKIWNIGSILKGTRACRMDYIIQLTRADEPSTGIPITTLSNNEEDEYRLSIKKTLRGGGTTRLTHKGSNDLRNQDLNGKTE